LTSLVIADLEETVAARLRERAARHGRSAEAEARAILCAAVEAEDSPPIPPAADNLADRIRRRFAPFGGVELPAGLRDSAGRAPPDFSGPGFGRDGDDR
jgi:plasmid stability protein